MRDGGTPLRLGPADPDTGGAGEALDLCFTLKDTWKAVDGVHPGMESALLSHLIEESIVTDIGELALAVVNVQSLQRGVTAARLIAPVKRGEYLLFEIKQSLEFLFDDGVDDTRDAELVRLSESHTDTSTHDGLALSLEGFAIHANKHREALITLPGFKAERIDEAFAVAQRLREQSGLVMSNAEKSEQERLLSLRNRLVMLLEDRAR